jgi:hypothetical protein
MPEHLHRACRPLSQAAARGELQKPCQYGKSILINGLIQMGAAPGGQKAPSRRHHPANNSCRAGRGKYPLTIPA